LEPFVIPKVFGNLCQLVINVDFRDDLAHSLGCPGAGGDDALASPPAAPPVLPAGPIHSLLPGRGSVHRGHEALQNPVVVIDHLGQGRQAVGRARVLDTIFMSGEYDSSLTLIMNIGASTEGAGDGHLLSTTFVMSSRFLQGSEHTSGFHSILGSSRSPINGRGIFLAKHGDGLSINHQYPLISFDLALVLSVRRVVLEHVDHVIQGDEGVVHSHKLKRFGEDLSSLTSLFRI